ncbi:hypothetical protein CHS0354_037093 [Potamilus streckersoni]|uniref:Mitochondria-eating protein C-terminal domain-containing protein n=1 Tax=Potamilus streckersoni TaxID=2493646 RepID=A0AAE0RP63_9BIVA|nr:hypothetical protein CHS0354_037093 [Potamilus streckersoni]
MGSSSSVDNKSTTPSKPATPRPVTPDDIKILIRETCSDKSKVEAALVKIKKIRSEMQTKNIKIGESRLSRLHRVEKEKTDLLNRLSSLASDRMRNQNAKIADLSDTNRPTKLTERFSELYDNEWTDAFTKLKEKCEHDDQTAIQTLLSILKNCYTKCEKIANSQRKELGQKFFSKTELKDPLFELRINECQKQIAEITYKDLQENFENLIDSRKEDKERNHEYLKLEPVKNYCKLCIELTWLMCIQAPPIKLDFIPKRETISNHFRHYTRSGEEFDFVVWPVLFLHANGSILSKGVIQFKASEKSGQKSSNMNSKDKTKVKTTPETKSEIKKENGSQNTEEISKDSTESKSSENENQENTNHSNAIKIENVDPRNKNPLGF